MSVSSQTSLGLARNWPRRQALLEPVALALTAAALVTLCVVSPLFLAVQGIDYDAAGGSAIEKIHPGTYLSVLALAVRLAAAPHPLRTLQRLLLGEPGLLIYLAALGLLAIYVAVVARLPVTLLIDSFLLALVLTLLLEGLNEGIARLLALLVVALFAADALLALTEFATGWRLIHISVPEGVTADPTRTDLVFDWRAAIAREWRATALFGHPLENAMLMGAFVIALASQGSRWLGTGLRLGLGIIGFLAMFAFGGRAALIFCGCGAVALISSRAARRLIAGRQFDLRLAGAVLLAMPVAAIALVLFTETGLFERVAQRFTTDLGSATSRVTMWTLFDPIPWRELFFGPDQAVVTTWQRLEGLEFGIESFWVAFALSYGLVMTTVLIAGLAAFVVSIVRLSGRGAIPVFLFFFAVASTSTSLSSKTTGFGILTVLILLVLRRDERKLTSDQLFRVPRRRG
jgi:hypothetical protein